MKKNEVNQIPWYHETLMLNCKECDRLEKCTIKDLKQCARSFEEWLEENAI